MPKTAREGLLPQLLRAAATVDRLACVASRVFEATRISRIVALAARAGKGIPRPWEEVLEKAERVWKLMRGIGR